MKKVFLNQAYWSAYAFQSKLSIAIEKWLEFKKTGKWKKKIPFRDPEHTDDLLRYRFHEELGDKILTFFLNDKKSLSLNFEKIGRKLKLFKSGDGAIELKCYHGKRVDRDLQKSLWRTVR